MSSFFYFKTFILGEPSNSNVIELFSSALDFSVKYGIKEVVIQLKYGILKIVKKGGIDDESTLIYDVYVAGNGPSKTMVFTDVLKRVVVYDERIETRLISVI